MGLAREKSGVNLRPGLVLWSDDAASARFVIQIDSGKGVWLCLN